MRLWPKHFGNSQSAATAEENAPSHALPGTLPAHVAIIMDGNGRWAQQRGLPRTLGHRQGSEALRTLIEHLLPLPIQHLTLYAFSAENWRRPAPEVGELMDLLRHYLAKEISTLHAQGVRLSVIGDRSQLSPDIRTSIDAAEQLTKHNTQLHICVALSYGSRQELVRAMQRLAQEVADGRLSPAAIDETALETYLDTQALPDPDLLIRTGGEQRLSNFLLWQSAYTELYFTPVLWPDFTITHLKEALAEYGRRERRYGRTSA